MLVGMSRFVALHLASRALADAPSRRTRNAVRAVVRDHRAASFGRLGSISAAIAATRRHGSH